MKIDKYPKSKELLKKKTIEALESFVDAFPVGEGFSKEFITEELVNSTMEATLENNPRHLYDFFDENKLYIVVTGEDVNWDWEINGKNGLSAANNRSEAEKEAFEEAFELLEVKL